MGGRERPADAATAAEDRPKVGGGAAPPASAASPATSAASAARRGDNGRARRYRLTPIGWSDRDHPVIPRHVLLGGSIDIRCSRKRCRVKLVEWTRGRIRAVNVISDRAAVRNRRPL